MTSSLPLSARNDRWFIDPTAIMQIKNLTMRARIIVEGFMSGLHRSPVHGFSVEFSEYRPYVIGDDTRNLDWKLLARTDRLYIKQFEDETNRRCYIAMDQSRSMSYGSLDYSKAEYSRTVAATLAYYFNLQRDAVGVFTCGNTSTHFVPPRHRPGHLQQIMNTLATPSDGTNSDLAPALTDLASQSRRRGLVVLISDLLTEPDTLYQPLGYLRGRGHEVHVLRILDPAELDLKLETGAMVQDLETGREIYIEPESARADYRKRFDKHAAQVTEICHKRGARISTLITNQPIDAALVELVSNRGGASASRVATNRAASNAGGRA